MSDPSLASTRVAFDLKGATLPMTAVVLKTTDLVMLAGELEKRLGDTPEFFDEDPVLIDVALLRDDPTPLNFGSLLALLREHHMVPIAVRGASAAQASAARAAGLAIAADAPPARASAGDIGPTVLREPADALATPDTAHASSRAAYEDPRAALGPASDSADSPPQSAAAPSHSEWPRSEARNEGQDPSDLDTPASDTPDAHSYESSPDAGDFADSEARDAGFDGEPRLEESDENGPTMRELIDDLPVVHPGTIVIDKPLRSGQQVYARNADLVVMAVVSFGAEVMADGNIHVYAPLRGRALAGVRGNTDARIFTTCLEPQLVSIAGIYRTTEVEIADDVLGKPAQIRLVGEKLMIEPLL